MVKEKIPIEKGRKLCFNNMLFSSFQARFTYFRNMLSTKPENLKYQNLYLSLMIGLQLPQENAF